MNSDALLQAAAELLENLDWKVVYLGGSTTHLHLTDAGAPEPELTDDVDVVVEITSPLEFQVDLREKLRSLGAREDTSEDAPVCRWLIGDVKIDVMTPNARVLGFANRWYELALKQAVPHTLRNGTQINLIAAPVFIATKLEAYLDRGAGDLLSSKDVEDIIAVVDGRPELPMELTQMPSELQGYVHSQLRSLRDDPDFLYAVEGYLHEAPDRSKIVFNAINTILSSPEKP